jgi:UDP-N-acetylglucosamine transferase subunit ALG13
MLFVTVGSTEFDALVRAADRLAAGMHEEVVVQIGRGRYTPGNARWFRFEPSLESYYAAASLVVAHGGLGTVTEVLQQGIPLVGVSNPDRYDRHQDQILRVLEEQGCLAWCRRLDELAEVVAQARRRRFVAYRPPPSHIGAVVRQFLAE